MGFEPTTPTLATARRGYAPISGSIHYLSKQLFYMCFIELATVEYRPKYPGPCPEKLIFCVHFAGAVIM